LRPVAALCLIALLSAGAAPGGEPATPAAELLKLSGAEAGLCVHVGTTDGKFEAELAKSGRFVVDGLAANAGGVEAARRHLRSEKLYGSVAVRLRPKGGLPYVDDLVNLLVVEDLSGLTLKDALRVAAPGGAVCVRGSSPAALSSAGFERPAASGAWTVGFKPAAEDVDEWSHGRRAADGNLTSKDMLVGPPGRVRWIDGPPSNPHFRGPAAAVAADGRLYYIMQDAYKPTATLLTARDAYSGVKLWEKKLQIKGDGRRSAAEVLRASIGTFRASTVAADGYLFTVLGAGKPLVALRGDTGEEVRAFGPDKPCQTLWHSGKLVLLTRGMMRALDVKTGRALWKHDGAIGHKAQMRAVIGGERIYYINDKAEILCLELASGKELWRKPAASWMPDWAREFKASSRNRASGHLRMACIYGGELVLGGRGGIHAVSARDGKHLWSTPHRIGDKSDYYSVYCTDDLAWFNLATGKWACRWVGLSMADGKEKKSFDYPKSAQGSRALKTRCSREDRVTGRYFIARSMTFLDRKTGEYTFDNVARGACMLSCIPAYGTVFDFPEQCGCFLMIRGVSALVTAPPGKAGSPGTPLLEKGPAFRRQAGGGARHLQEPAVSLRDQSRLGLLPAPGRREDGLALPRDAGGAADLRLRPAGVALPRECAAGAGRTERVLHRRPALQPSRWDHPLRAGRGQRQGHQVEAAERSQGGQEAGNPQRQEGRPLRSRGRFYACH
jgi:outer membrane protein assembly factor BamB